MESIRAITWNLGNTGDIKLKLDLLRETINEAGKDTGVIVCLQEVNSSCYHELISCGMFATVTCSLNVRRPERFHRGLRVLQGCAFGCNEKIFLGTSSATTRLALTDNASAGQEGKNGDTAHVVNIHSLGSEGLSRNKSAHFSSVAQYLYDLAEHNESVIFCGEIDEDSQKQSDNTDSAAPPHSYDNDFSGSFFGVNPRQHLQDALRMWLKSNPVYQASLLKTQTNIPLAVTLIKGGYYQYDFVLISPHWTVKHIDQRHQESVRAGNEYPMVVCDLAREAA